MGQGSRAGGLWLGELCLFVLSPRIKCLALLSSGKRLFLVFLSGKVTLLFWGLCVGWGWMGEAGSCSLVFGISPLMTGEGFK